MKFKKNLVGVVAAVVAAAISVASMSVCAFADDVSLTGGPFEVTIGNHVSAEGYEDEAEALLNFMSGDVGFYNNVIEGILTDDTVITVNSGSVDLSALKYAIFYLYNFSEDKTTPVLRHRITVHSHLAIVCFPWSIGGTNLGSSSYEVTEQIDGCDIAKCYYYEDLIVVGNKISGNLIRQIVDQSYDVSSSIDGEVYGPNYNLNDYDAIQILFPYETEEGEMYHSLLFLTESYANGGDGSGIGDGNNGDDGNGIGNGDGNSTGDGNNGGAGDTDTDTDKDKDIPDTGVEGVAVIAGLAIITAAAVIITKKRK